MALQLTFKTSSSGGTYKPAIPPVPWYPNPTALNLSYDGNTTGSTFGWYATVKSGTKTDFYFQYGQNANPWATAKVLHYSIDLTNQVTHADGSITTTVKFVCQAMKSVRTQHAGSVGYPVVITGTLDGKTIWSHTGNTLDEFTAQPSTATWTRSITIAPQKDSEVAMTTLRWHYPSGPYTENTFKIGLTVHNSNKVPTTPPVVKPPDPTPTPVQNYIPMAIRKGGIWKSLNDNNGMIQIRKSGTWHDISKEDYPAGEQNKGHNQIRKSGKWLKQSEY